MRQVEHVERLLMASIHKALEDLAPEQIEIFEAWFDPRDRRARVHIAPVIGAIGYLRRNPGLYVKVMDRAGRYASQWSYLERPRLERKLLGALPRPARMPLAGYLLRSGLRRVQRDADLKVRREGPKLVVTVRNSLFCRGGAAGEGPLCCFYASLFAGLLERAALARPPVVESRCRGQGELLCRFEASA